MGYAVKDAWDGYFAAKRTPVSDPSETRYPVNDLPNDYSETRYPVNDFFGVVVHDEAGAHHVFEGAHASVRDGIVEIWLDGDEIATFRKWISVLRIKDYAELEALVAATTQAGQPFADGGPPKRPRMRANMAPREEG